MVIHHNTYIVFYFKLQNIYYYIIYISYVQVTYTYISQDS